MLRLAARISRSAYGYFDETPVVRIVAYRIAVPIARSPALANAVIAMRPYGAGAFGKVFENPALCKKGVGDYRKSARDIWAGGGFGSYCGFANLGNLRQTG